MDTISVRDHFREQVADYPGLMSRIIPGYDEQRDVIVRLIPFGRDRCLRVLDLGCGPGLLGEQILSEFPNAGLTVLDLTSEMLEACRARLGDQHRVRYRLADLREDLGSGYDVIVASLSLQHLTLSERPEFFARVFTCLNPGGALIAAEVIVDECASVRESQYQLWRAFMVANGEDGERWFKKHLEKDHPAMTSSLVTWLEQAGFANVGCYWRNLNFAVIRASKATA